MDQLEQAYGVKLASRRERLSSLLARETAVADLLDVVNRGQYSYHLPLGQLLQPLESPNLACQC
jgi:hypothetical protein